MTDPRGVFVTSAITYHEWFLSLQQAGFTEEQALHLVAQGLFAAQFALHLRTQRF